MSYKEQIVIFDPTGDYGLGWYNVKAYGAIGDGVTDDRSAIQSALDAAEDAGGGVVYVPDGTYLVLADAFRTGILIGDNTTLLGNGVTSEILFTPGLLTSNGIINKNNYGALTEAEQRVGNVNITIKGIKLRCTRTVEFLDIGISLSGVDGFLIQDTVVEDVGGYCYLIGRTNDDATIGSESRNGVLENIKAFNVMDQGLEIWGATNVRANNIYMEGPGLTTGYGHGCLVWHGAQDITVTNLTVKKIDVVGRNMAAIAAVGWGGTPGVTAEERKTQNIVFDNVNANTDIAIRINSAYNVDTAILRVDGVTIRNSVFNGFDAATKSGDIRHTEGLRIEGCKFTNFLSHLKFTDPGSTTLQNTVLNVDIKNCEFDGGDGMEIFGLRNFRFINNKFINIGDSPAVTVFGGRYGVVDGNSFIDIGATVNTNSVVLKQLDESSTVESQYIDVSNNIALNVSRIYTHTFLVLLDATDFITIRNNNKQFAASGAQEYANAGTGTIVRSDSGIYTPNTSAEVNLDAGLVVSDLHFFRQGTKIQVFGRFTANPTAAVLTGFQIQIPPAYNSNLFAADELSGFAVSGGTTNMTAEIFGNNGNNTAQVRWIATDLTAQEWSFQFSYTINEF